MPVRVISWIRSDAPVLFRSGEEIRELIIDWVERHKTIPAEPTNNWKIVWE